MPAAPVSILLPDVITSSQRAATRKFPSEWTMRSVETPSYFDLSTKGRSFSTKAFIKVMSSPRTQKNPLDQPK